MQYRKLGNTGLEVSAIGLGCVQLASSRLEVAAEIVRRAVGLGITYFDVARGYGDSEIKLGLGLGEQRESVIISTKTGARSREDAWREINESLERLGTDYVDNLHLHALRSQDDIDRRLGHGGALEALLEARDQGMTRHLGCTSHRSEILVDALRRFDFEIVLVPMNVVEQEPLGKLIPLCRTRGVGVTVMKPLATGLLPAPLALKWLLNQPIASAVPGITTLEELEEDAAVGWQPFDITQDEQESIQATRQQLEHIRCRICGLCHPCPQEISMAITLGSDVVYDHYRTMGRDTFRSFPWSHEVIEAELLSRPKRIASIESCTRCRACEERCPYGLPVMDMLADMLPSMRDIVLIFQDLADGG